jgi:DNA helicase-2/ATP-dependent DNA helicase PcrA
MAKTKFIDEIEEIMFHIQKGHNFLLSGGAGSGKTYSLVQTLKHIAVKYPTARVACVTYTNAAALEVKNRANIKNLRVSTIHDFLWDTIAPFQKEMKQTLIELINDPESAIKNPNADGKFACEFENGILYKEYVRLERGEISHDEVLVLAHRMYSKYIRLCDILKDSFQFIFVDEYQDTSPLVIELLLSCLQKSKRKHVLGFFGDTMQSIYESGVGDIDYYVLSGQVQKVEKKQNRRNPNTVIQLANQLRTDGLIQEPSDDITAPNMVNGVIKEGSIKFLYSKTFDLSKVKLSDLCNKWDFVDSKKTKELRLTHNLIADEAGFSQLMAIYDSDPISKFKKEFKEEAKKRGITFDMMDTFETVVNSMDWTYKKGERAGRQRKDVFLEDAISAKLYEHVKDWTYQKVSKIYLDKDNLIDDRVVIDGVTIREPKRDRLIQHLFKIQEVISLYQNKQYNDLIQKISWKIQSIGDKKLLKNTISELENLKNSTVEKVIEFADTSRLCVKDDRLNDFIMENEYLFWRIKDIPFIEFQNLYQYLEGFVPLSTQHKIKGLEFNNVLVVLHNGGWSNYNFEYLFDKCIYDSLTPARQKSYSNILLRTQKLFYVCCTRAKDNLVVFYPDPSQGVLSGAEILFGKENCINLDERI